MRTLLVGLGALYLAILAALGPALAEDGIPLRAGRISLVQGNAGYRPVGGEWFDAAMNLPVAAGTALRTGDKGSAEFRLGAVAVALAGGSQIEIAHLEPHLVRLTLEHGRVGLVVRELGDGDNIEINLPNGAVRLLEPGHYDIRVGSDSAAARIAVFDGRAHFTAGGDDSTIAPGSTVRLDGVTTTATRFEPARPDSFDTALQARVSEDESTASRIHLSPELAGLAELDQSGDWRAVDGYGVAWFPESMPDGWAPYRDGSWRWIPPWGWTWIDHASWGFAPSHYGRWARIDDSWAWVPGKPVADPAYAPAVVAFIGTPGVGLSYADAFTPAIAWFPLGPDEVYWPGFTRDTDLIRHLNAADVDDLSVIRLADNGGLPPAISNADYQNRRFTSAVPRSVFMAGQQIAPALLSIPKARLDTVPLIAETTQFPPAPAPRPVAVASAPSNKSAPLVAAARAALPALVAAAHDRAHGLARLAHLAHGNPAPSHAAVVQRGAHALGRLRVMASLSGGHGEAHRHLAVLRGRAR